MTASACPSVLSLRAVRKSFGARVAADRLPGLTYWAIAWGDGPRVPS